MRYLTLSEVTRINEKIHGGQAQIRDSNLLESAIARPMTSAFGQDAYPTLVEKAAALLHSLVMNHPFVDGNKRTATVATVFFLEENGLHVTWSTDGAYHFIVDIAEQQHDVEQIACWLAENTQAIDE